MKCVVISSKLGATDNPFYKVSSSKEGADSDFQKHIVDVSLMGSDNNTYLMTSCYRRKFWLPLLSTLGMYIVSMVLHSNELDEDILLVNFLKRFNYMYIHIVSYWPRMQAKNLKICITAGVGSDHIDLNAAVDHRIQVLEVPCFPCRFLFLQMLSFPRFRAPMLCRSPSTLLWAFSSSSATLFLLTRYTFCTI